MALDNANECWDNMIFTKDAIRSEEIVERGAIFIKPTGKFMVMIPKNVVQQVSAQMYLKSRSLCWEDIRPSDSHFMSVVAPACNLDSKPVASQDLSNLADIPEDDTPWCVVCESLYCEHLTFYHPLEYSATISPWVEGVEGVHTGDHYPGQAVYPDWGADAKNKAEPCFKDLSLGRRDPDDEGSALFSRQYSKDESYSYESYLNSYCELACSLEYDLRTYKAVWYTDDDVFCECAITWYCTFDQALYNLEKLNSKTSSGKRYLACYLEGSELPCGYQYGATWERPAEHHSDAHQAIATNHTLWSRPNEVEVHKLEDIEPEYIDQIVTQGSLIVDRKETLALCCNVPQVGSLVDLSNLADVPENDEPLEYCLENKAEPSSSSVSFLPSDKSLKQGSALFLASAPQCVICDANAQTCEHSEPYEDRRSYHQPCITSDAYVVLPGSIQIYVEKRPGYYEAHYKEVEADIVGNFAVHSTSGMQGEYTLTHVPSGCAMASTLLLSQNRSKAALLGLASSLNEYGIDWSFSLSDVLAKDKEVLEKLNVAKVIVDSFYKHDGSEYADLVAYEATKAKSPIVMAETEFNMTLAAHGFEVTPTVKEAFKDTTAHYRATSKEPLLVAAINNTYGFLTSKLVVSTLRSVWFWSYASLCVLWALMQLGWQVLGIVVKTTYVAYKLATSPKAVTLYDQVLTQTLTRLCDLTDYAGDRWSLLWGFLDAGIELAIGLLPKKPAVIRYFLD